MSQIYVAGPCEVFVGLGGGGSLEFLGWSQEEVIVSPRAAYEDVPADFGGPMIPVDSQFMGEDATWGMTLIRYNEFIMNQVTARRRGAIIGFGEFGAIGSLMIAEGFAYRVVLFSPYVQKTVFAATMNPGYNFPAAYVIDNFDVPISTRAKRPRLMFRALPVYEVVNNGLVYTLYNGDVSGMPPIN